MKDNLTVKTFFGTFWMTIALFFARLSRVISFIIMARILQPKDFGIFAIVTMCLGILDILTSLGFEVSLIQKKDEISEIYLNTAWTTNVIRGVIIWLIMFILAPYIALFFKIPQSTNVIKIAGLCAFLNGFTNIGTLFFFKEMDFRKKVYMDVTGNLIYVIVSVTFAYRLRNVWALLLGYIGMTLSGLLISYLLHPYRPKIMFDLTKAKEMFNFGKWILGLNVTRYFSSLIDEGFVGKIMEPIFLGFYNKAKTVAYLPLSFVYQVISKVTFPVYSKLQDIPEEVQKKFYQIFYFTLSIIILFNLILFITVEDLIKILLGDRWLPMVEPLKILLFVIIFKAILEISYPLFKGLGKPDSEFKFDLLQVIIYFMTLYPLIKFFGMKGAAISSFLCSFIVAIFVLLQLVKINILKVNKLVSFIIYNVFGWFIIYYFLKILKIFIPRVNIYIYIVLFSVSIVFIYFLYLYFMWKCFKMEEYLIFKKTIELVKNLIYENKNNNS